MLTRVITAFRDRVPAAPGEDEPTAGEAHRHRRSACPQLSVSVGAAPGAARRHHYFVRIQQKIVGLCYF